LFDSDPGTKEALLLDARKVTRDPVVKAQIDDDLKRLGFLGKPLPLRFTALDGSRADAKDWRGKVVVLVFFATWSEPAKNGFARLQRTVERAGGGVQLVAISLDANRASLEAYVRERKVRCPVAWAEKGWNSPLIQALGINALPSAWLLDRQGVVRSLDALEEPEEQVRGLLDSK
jgi:thiol-disulfide isomerase/thioredoxin